MSTMEDQDQYNTEKKQMSTMEDQDQYDTEKNQMSTMEDPEEQDPKITLLRQKLALLIGREDCPVYDTINAQNPRALEEPWSLDMSGPQKYVGKELVPYC